MMLQLVPVVGRLKIVTAMEKEMGHGQHPV